MAIDVQSVALNARDTYSYNNSSIFFSLVNEAFLPYYQNIIRKASNWLDGYDPGFHKEEMVSSRIAAKLFNGFARAIYGRGLVFKRGKGNTDEANKALNFISNIWAEDSGIDEATKMLIGMTHPLGTGAMKVNRDSRGKLWVESLRIDYFYFSCDGRKRVTQFTSFIRAFQSVDKKEENFFLVEKRYFKTFKDTFVKDINGKKIRFDAPKTKPVVEYRVYRYSGTVNNNTMPTSIDDKNLVNFKNLPSYVKNAINRDYGFIKVGEPQILPFADDYLGVEIFRNESGDITNPTLPFGRVTAFDCLVDLMEYDMDRSYGIRDLFNSKGTVGVPKALNQASLTQQVPGTGGNMVRLNPLATFNIPGYELVDGLDPNTQKPIITQFEMRAEEHEKKQMAILKQIAITVGVSPRSIASFLVQDGEKTDDQIQSEDDTITQWIKDHRKDYVKGLNRIIECVLNYNGFQDNVEVKFASDGLVKGDKQLEQIEKKLELGLMTKEDAIRELNPDMDEEQLKSKIAEVKKLEEQKAQEQINEVNDYGDFTNGSKLF